MTGLHFVDSNVLVYRHDRDEPDRQQRAQSVMKALWQLRAGRVSTQVLHEFYVVVTRKLATPVDRDLARAEVRQLETWRPVVPTLEVRQRAWSLEDRFALSWWDALIVAAAQHAGCSAVLTEDLQDGQQFDGVHIVDPFTREPGELGLE
jgi:predicted nucleic acid-binding protein